MYMDNKIYLCIDLKTFYASVECVERGLDPFITDLIVADPARANGAICLAISHKIKARGIKNRCMVWVIPKNVKSIVVKHRMKKYMEYSARIYSMHLDYIDKDDIHVYSVDEEFLDVTTYLKLYKKTPLELAKTIMKSIYEKTGITATAGIGKNLYLTKIALDITAKQVESNIGYLDEKKYKPKSNSVSNSQILFQDYNYINARKVLIEMIDYGTLQLVSKDMYTSIICFLIGYSKDAIPPRKYSKKLCNMTNGFTTIMSNII